MNTLTLLENFINEFNRDYDIDFNIDSIRVEFSKEHKKEKLEQLGSWNKLHANNKTIVAPLKKELNFDSITSVYKLKNENIYYYNSSTPPKYRKATMVIFGMKQYHKESPRRSLIEAVISIIKGIDNIDLCLDLLHKPNFEIIKKIYTLKRFITPNGYVTDTRYINEPDITMIEKIIIYNKALKGSLDYTLWRIEAKIIIPNIKYLALPLHEFKEFIDLTKVKQ